ncbi:DUF1853 family protein [Neisseria lisongii]|uniref:DUF1853 family protein n=1 Tax=Neisseria lisongii TaxID=2912188 RepID=A0AAW5AKI5_9NEIS|nr:DUF1853 family protein [Neisseria lisongii]MCF7528796.1 DUF1853 family protein [Neisseria lisongii]MCF7529654.1 DUF1853 family protein [Neisseria lisongii]
MNYALDALWWKLTRPAVRDLASLLTAPPLWHSGCELNVRTLLGEQGFRYLLSLDANPQPLETHLAAHRPFHYRLGQYAEQLLAFWFAHAPHSELLAHNLSVFAQGLTLGAADFIAKLNGEAYHIELTCKYYGSANGSYETLRGLNRQDRLADKAAKLPQQLLLFKFSDGLHTLAAHHLPTDLKTASIVRGIGFFPAAQQTFEPPLNPYGWRGVYLERWDECPPDPERRYCLLERMAYLAPARIKAEQTLSAAEITAVESGLVAVLEQRPDGCWHEILRIMKAMPSENRTRHFASAENPV